MNNNTNSVAPAVAEKNASVSSVFKNEKPVISESKINPTTEEKKITEVKTIVAEKNVAITNPTVKQNSIAPAKTYNSNLSIKSRVKSRKEKSENNVAPVNNKINENGNAIVVTKSKKNNSLNTATETKEPIINLEEKPESGNNQIEIANLLNQTPSQEISTENLKTPELVSNVPKKDSITIAVVNSSVSTEAAKPIINITSSWHLTLAGGANYASDFSINPIGGFEISKTFLSLFDIGTGLYYTYLTLQEGNVKTFTLNTTYDFGYTNELSEIKTDKLHYMMMPIYSRFNINARNSIVFGANFYYLFTTSNKVTTSSESYSVRRNSVSSDQFGYSSGFNNFDAAIMVGYKLKLFANLGVAINFNYGFYDIKKDAYYNESKFDRNISGQLLLTYNIFK